MLKRNVSGQRWLIFAYNRTTNVPVLGDAANISAKIRKDYAAAVATDDAAPDELEDGYYEFALTQAETNADVLDLLPESTTSNVQLVGVPGRDFTEPAEESVGEPATLDDIAGAPRIVQAGTERIEEHSLKDQIEYQKYKASQLAGASGAALPVRQWRQTHGRP